jgi:GDP-mannose transporter
MAPVTFLFCLMLWTSGKALRFVSMPIFTVFKNLAVVGTTSWEYVRYGSKVSAGIVLSLALMVGGSIVAGAGDLTASREGIFWMMVNVVMTVSYVASLKELVPPNLPASAKTLANNYLSMFVFLGGAVANGELGAFWESLLAQSRLFKLALLFTGIIGTAINMSTFWCARVTSGATYAFVGASNKIPVAVIGHFAFHSVLTISGWMGVALGLGAGIVFAITKERERRQAAAAAVLAREDSAADSEAGRAEGGLSMPGRDSHELDSDDEGVEYAPLAPRSSR